MFVSGVHSYSVFVMSFYVVKTRLCNSATTISLMVSMVIIYKNQRWGT